VPATTIGVAGWAADAVEFAALPASAGSCLQ
jgi:hypothetical protein